MLAAATYATIYADNVATALIRHAVMLYADIDVMPLTYYFFRCYAIAANAASPFRFFDIATPLRWLLIFFIRHYAYHPRRRCRQMVTTLSLRYFFFFRFATRFIDTLHYAIHCHC